MPPPSTGSTAGLPAAATSPAQTVRDHFDGTSSPAHWQDPFKVLLATDKMSEGFNLNRAGLAISEIKCPFDTERGRDFAETFWDDYQTLQAALSDRRHGPAPGTTSLFAKARNVLLDMTAQGIGGSFAKMQDIRNRRFPNCTLPFGCWSSILWR